MNTEPGFEIRPARYAKKMIAVHCVSDGSGHKTRAMRLIADHLKARWSGREKAYIATPAKGEKLKALFAAGQDACVMTGNLYHAYPVDTYSFQC
jgi:hypothetical protein